jgi:hypothetical protein
MGKSAKLHKRVVSHVSHHRLAMILNVETIGAAVKEVEIRYINSHLDTDSIFFPDASRVCKETFLVEEREKVKGVGELGKGRSRGGGLCLAYDGWEEEGERRGEKASAGQLIGLHP